MKSKYKGTPPVNFLRFLTEGNCGYCKLSETETYVANERTQERKPLWICLLRPDIAKGHIACTIEDWQNCPLRK